MLQTITTTTKSVEQMLTAIAQLDLESVKTRVMDPKLGEGWTRDHADSIEAAYKRYLVMQAKYPDVAHQILLAKDVDEFWHTHILQTQKYARDCETVFGFFLHHDPHVGPVTEEVHAERDLYAEKTRQLYEMEFGGLEEAEVAWMGASPTSTFSMTLESDIQAASAAMSASPIRGTNAAMSASPIRGATAAMSASPIRGVNAAMSASPIRDANAAMSASPIRGANAVMSASPIRGVNAAMSASPIRGANAAMSASPIRGGNAAMSASPIRGANAAMSASPIRMTYANLVSNLPHVALH